MIHLHHLQYETGLLQADRFLSIHADNSPLPDIRISCPSLVNPSWEQLGTKFFFIQIWIGEMHEPITHTRVYLGLQLVKEQLENL